MTRREQFTPEQIDRYRKRFERLGGTIEVERSGLCSICGSRISDTDAGHGSLVGFIGGGSLCHGKPDRAWRYRCTVTLCGRVLPAAAFPHLSGTFSRLLKQAKQEHRSIRINGS